MGPRFEQIIKLSSFGKNVLEDVTKFLSAVYIYIYTYMKYFIVSLNEIDITVILGDRCCVRFSRGICVWSSLEPANPNSSVR